MGCSGHMYPEDLGGGGQAPSLKARLLSPHIQYHILRKEEEEEEEYKLKTCLRPDGGTLGALIGGQATESN